MPIVNVLFHACCPCNVETQYGYYSHKAIFLKNLDNSGEKAIESESLQLNKNAYGIRLYFEREKVVVACAKQLNSFFIQSAYATSCLCPPEFIYSPGDSIKSIKIFTSNNFDNQHLANSDITNYFRVAYSYSTVEKAVENMRNSYTFPSDIEFEQTWEKEVIIDLLLMTAPIATNKQQFKVQVELSDGRILEQLTPEIELL